MGTVSCPPPRRNLKVEGCGLLLVTIGSWVTGSAAHALNTLPGGEAMGLEKTRGV